MLWNVRKIREGFRKKPGKISHNLPFSLLIPDFEMVNSGTGREWKISIPKVWEREGNEKIHSQNSGTGREWKKSIPEIREREGNEKNPFPKFGKGIRGLHSWEWPGTGIPAHPWEFPPIFSLLTMVTLIVKSWHYSSFWARIKPSWHEVHVLVFTWEPTHHLLPYILD